MKCPARKFCRRKCPQDRRETPRTPWPSARSAVWIRRAETRFDLPGFKNIFKTNMPRCRDTPDGSGKSAPFPKHSRTRPVRQAPCAPSRPPRGGREGAQGACRTGRVRLCFGNGALFPEPSGVSRHLGMFVLKIFLKPGRSKRVSALLIHTALRADGQGVRGVSRLSCGHFRRQNFRAGHFNFNHLLLMRNLHERHS